jgi:hypothetical protein
METPDKAFADINIKLGHKRQAAAWSVVGEMIWKTGHKIRIELRLLTDGVQYYEGRLEKRIEATDKEMRIVKIEIGLIGRDKAETGSRTRLRSLRNVKVWRKEKKIATVYEIVKESYTRIKQNKKRYIQDT